MVIRIGIVGLHNHYHAYPFAKELVRGVPGLELVGVADEREELVKTFADEHGCAWTTTTPS
jgi:predicted dehydrogenase